MSFLFEQLPLALQRRDDATFDNFYPGDNALLLTALRHQLAGGEQFLYLHGAAGSGRSHLLQAACHHADADNQRAVYLPLQELRDYPPEALFEGLEQMALVCLDDIQAVAGDSDWERELFHLYNRLRDSGVSLLVSADAPVHEVGITLPDLRSRLSWGAVYRLQVLNESQQREMIRMRARHRGLPLNDEVVQFIAHRCRRDPDSLIAVLDRLDQASLRAQRRLTIPFVKAVMEW